jgi:hypothetical protein
MQMQQFHSGGDSALRAATLSCSSLEPRPKELTRTAGISLKSLKPGGFRLTPVGHLINLKNL